MFWLHRPPYLRWIAAAVLLCTGIMLDLRSPPTVKYPFAADPIAAGELIETVAWREVPVGVLPDWNGPPGGTAIAAIPLDSPILPFLTVEASPIPRGWWVIALPMPGLVAPGTPVRIAADGVAADGIIAGETVDSGFEFVAPVAFPPELADRVAALVSNSALVVMTGT